MNIVSSVCIGMYISNETADSLCRWLTSCIKGRMPAQQFNEEWRKFEDHDLEENCAEETAEAFYGSWCEELHQYSAEGNSKIPTLYAEAFDKGAGGFVNVGDQETQYIVALRGVGMPTLHELKVHLGEPE